MAEYLIAYEDVCRIAKYLNQEGYGDSNITVSIGVKDKATLNKLNEDFYYRTKHAIEEHNQREDIGEKDKLPIPEYQEDVDEMSVTISGIVFMYYVKPTENHEENKS